jgi:cytidyltransferase-like protein
MPCNMGREVNVSRIIGRKTVCISGGFDPVHPGHIDLIQDAARYGDVVVILNSDAWLVRKKGARFQVYESRAHILMAIAGVVDVVSVDDNDGTVCEALRRIRPDCFANGGDRTDINTPELVLCDELGIQALFGIGGDKRHSSSEIVGRLK